MEKRTPKGENFEGGRERVESRPGVPGPTGFGSVDSDLWVLGIMLIILITRVFTNYWVGFGLVPSRFDSNRIITNV